MMNNSIEIYSSQDGSIQLNMKLENNTDNDKHYFQKTYACMMTNEELVTNEELRDTIKYDYNRILVSMKGTNF